MLVASAWRPDGPTGSVEEILERSELAHYIAGWPQPGDLGVVAEDESPVGAAWIRLLPESDPGFGFVNASTPELSMGVVQEWRGQGVGARLLEALISSARAHNLAGISLSVNPDNYALRLYERVGFREVRELNGSLTMVLHL
jgi:ribosomal protein S18 acetylase RimI-like enzyme